MKLTFKLKQGIINIRLVALIGIGHIKDISVVYAPESIRLITNDFIFLCVKIRYVKFDYAE